MSWKYYIGTVLVPWLLLHGATATFAKIQQFKDESGTLHITDSGEDAGKGKPGLQVPQAQPGFPQPPVEALQEPPPPEMVPESEPVPVPAPEAEMPPPEIEQPPEEPQPNE